MGPEAHKLTAEQRAAEINKALDEVAEYEALPENERMRLAIVDAYDAMRKAMRRVQLTREEEFGVNVPAPERSVRLDVFSALDLELAQLGNWLTAEERKARREADRSL